MNKMLFWIAVAAVIVVAVVAGVVSYDHLHTVAVAAGEQDWIAKLVPLSADGLLVSASLSAFVAKWQGRKVHAMTKLSLAVGLTASIAANIASPFVGNLTGSSQDILAAIVGAWPAIALALSFEEVLRLSSMWKTEAHTDMPIAAPTASHTATFTASVGKDTGEGVSEASSAYLSGVLPTPDSEALPEVSVAGSVVEILTPLPLVATPTGNAVARKSERNQLDRKRKTSGTSTVKAEALAYIAEHPETPATDLAEMFGRSDRWARLIRKEFQESKAKLELVTA